jgi:hypothetical protein
MTKKEMIRLESIKKELAMIEEGNIDILDSNETFLDRAMYLAYQLVELLEGD